MKKVAATIASLGFLTTAVSAFAQVNINIIPPKEGINPTVPLGSVISNIITIIFAIAALIVLFMLVIGAFQWITSGGEKDAVGKARSRITHALIGLAILALAFLITTVIGQILGINVLNQTLPKLDQVCPTGKVFVPTNPNDPAVGSCQPATQ